MATEWVAQGFIVRFIAATVMTVMLAGLPYLAYAGDLNGYFTVSVHVINRCQLTLPSTRSQTERFTLACTRDTGYRVLMEGRQIEVGAGTGRSEVLQLTRTIPKDIGAGGVQWLTILY